MPKRSAEQALPALLLAAVWLALTLVIVAGTAGGLAQLLLAIVTLLPVGLCLLGVARAAVVQVGPAALLGTGMLALALSLPLPALLAEPLLAEGRAPGLISGTARLALLAGLVASCYYAALLLGRPARAGAVAGMAGALGLIVSVAATLAAPADVRAIPGCATPALLENARFELAARAEVDGRQLAVLTLAGDRAGERERWSAWREGALVTGSRLDVVRLEGGSWLRTDDGEWQAVSRLPDDMASGAPTIEASVAAVLVQGQLAAAEDLSVELLDGLPARHCRLMIDGTMAGRALPPLGWLLGGAPLEGRTELPIWRGELDWWLDGAGTLRRAELIVGGHPRDVWDMDGLRGRLLAELSLVEPAQPPLIEQPLP